MANVKLCIAMFQYVRLDSQTPMDVVWTLLSDYWHMPPPKLIVSVTGGAKSFFMKSRLKTSFKRGLVNAATSSGRHTCDSFALVIVIV